jgi:hypothetical protein
MKHLSLLVLLSCYCFIAFAQQKATFGLVVKAGNYTLPYQHKSESFYFHGQRFSKYVIFQNAGATYSFGINGSLRLGGHFRVSGELLYRVANYSFGFDQELLNVGETTPFSSSNDMHQINESSLFLPVKIHFSFLKNGRTSITLGAGLFHFLNVSNKGETAYKNVGFSDRYYSYHLPDIDIINSDDKPEMAITAGVSHRLDKHTTIGLEFTYERRAADKIFFSYYAPDSVLSFISYGFFQMEAPSMRSLSLNLYHILSRK